MEYTKPKIMRRVAFSKSEDARTCLSCGFVLMRKSMPEWVHRLTCPRCKTTIQVKHTDNNTVVLTNEEYADLFDREGGAAQIWIKEEENDDNSGTAE